jgi:HlyD family secretion protein
MKKKIVSIWSRVMAWSFFGKAAAILLVLVIIFAGYRLFLKPKEKTQFVPVVSGSITETVSVTGNTVPVRSVSLSFENGGTVSAVYSDVGHKVSAGDLLVSLKADDLSAQENRRQEAP